MARPFVTVPEFVRASLAAADPYYHGPGVPSPHYVDDEIAPLDPRKTARDLGHLEPETLERLERLHMRPLPPSARTGTDDKRDPSP